MNQVKQLPWDAIENDLEAKARPGQQIGDASLTNVLRVIGPFDDLAADTTSARRPPPKDWSMLIDRVRNAANRMRDVEAEAHEQELRVQQLLERVREDIRESEERVKESDARVREANARAAALLKAADERVQEAEERARVAEEWLSRIHETIAGEFFQGPTELPRG